MVCRNLGVGAGDRVAVLHPNHKETLLAYYGIVKAGGVVVPTNSAYTAPEMKFIFTNSGAKILITTERFMPAIDQIKSQLPDLNHIIRERKRIRWSTHQRHSRFSSAGCRTMPGKTR